jgi:nucleoside diphosphate kinase
LLHDSATHFHAVECLALFETIGDKLYSAHGEEIRARRQELERTQKALRDRAFFEHIEQFMVFPLIVMVYFLKKYT